MPTIHQKLQENCRLSELKKNYPSCYDQDYVAIFEIIDKKDAKQCGHALETLKTPQKKTVHFFNPEISHDLLGKYQLNCFCHYSYSERIPNTYQNFQKPPFLCILDNVNSY